jgi:cytidyltransferase-like protein
MTGKKIFVSGCFDLLHAGHIAFLKTASNYGKLHVSVGRDDNLLLLKGRKPYFSQAERLFMVRSIKYVENAFIASGSGYLDFEPDLYRIRPDIFIVNQDGNSIEKEKLCSRLGIEYLVLERIPEPGLPVRSSSGTKKELRFPYRLCLAGGWIDQPWVSAAHPGSVVVAQIWPTMDFNDRSGLATSSRNIAIHLWGDRYPEGDYGQNARLLFGAENPPGKLYISGSQDHIGLLYPGINRLFYNGDYWPESIESTVDNVLCDWLSDVLWLIPLEPRPEGYDPLKIKNLETDLVRELGESGDNCWKAIINRDVDRLGKAMKATFLSWSKILPLTIPDTVMKEMISDYFSVYPGAITSGCGGGYIIVASDREVKGAIRIKVRY